MIKALIILCLLVAVDASALTAQQSLFKKTYTQALKGDEAKVAKVAKEESKYLMQAMKILSAEEDVNRPAVTRMQNKFGKDMAGATQLANLLFFFLYMFNDIQLSNELVGRIF